ncbi:phytase [candidate division KSB1 bacterium]|nr:phytase [candidate division KSB1 bacterium]
MKAYVVLMVSCFTFIAMSCDRQDEFVNTRTTISETYQTERFIEDNIDSPAMWYGPHNEHWLIATAKEGNCLYVCHADNGTLLFKVGLNGNISAEFKRPNGISIIDDLLLVVERDNHRVQVFSLPEFMSLGMIGENDLILPYGLYVMHGDGVQQYVVYVTDNYLTVTGQIPPDNKLGKRIHQYTFSTVASGVSAKLVRTFGDTAGAGCLKVVESIFGDPVYKILLIAEEKPGETSVKVYTLDGKFTGVVVGENLFKYQVEGIALYEKDRYDGYWVVTDQDLQDNRFQVFDRRTLFHRACFKGANTSNTDGIWISRQAFGPFSQGAMFAIHDDGNVSAFDWKTVLTVIGL